MPPNDHTLFQSCDINNLLHMRCSGMSLPVWRIESGSRKWQGAPLGELTLTAFKGKQRRHRVRTWAGSFFSHSQTIKLWINVGCFLVSSDVHSNTRRNVHLSSATARWGSLNLRWPCHVTLRGLDSPRLTVKQSFLTSPELWTSDGWGEETERLWIWFSTRTLLKLETESIKSGVRQEVMLPLSIYST